MKILFATLAAATALTAAGAATAQPYGYDRGYQDAPRYEQGYRDNGGYGRGDRRWERNQSPRVAIAEREIERGMRRGDLTPPEAARLRAEVRDLARDEWRLSRDGVSYRERAALDRRFDLLMARINYERQDRDYGYGYGRR